MGQQLPWVRWVKKSLLTEGLNFKKYYCDSHHCDLQDLSDKWAIGQPSKNPRKKIWWSAELRTTHLKRRACKNFVDKLLI
jgi:hypothetical protein